MENMGQGLVIALIGYCLVFTVLAIIWGILELMHRIITPKAKPAKQQATPETPAPAAPAQEAAAVDDDELIAVLTAAVAASLNTSTYNLRIRSYREVPQKAPAWNRAARNENLLNRL